MMPDEVDSFLTQVSQGEGMHTEFKATLRVSLHTGQNDPKMEHAVLKTVAAFLNSKGGTLFVGVADDGEAIGLENDGFESEDKLALRLDNLIKSRLGAPVFASINVEFIDLGGKRALAIQYSESKEPVFLKNGNVEESFIRAGASSPALPASHTHEYIHQRFR